MIERVSHDLNLVSDTLRGEGISCSLRRFGSSALCLSEGNDVDVAVVVERCEQKDAATSRLRHLAAAGTRRLDWLIDSFENDGKRWGYNTKYPQTLHLFVISQNELRSDSPMSVNIRNGDVHIP